MTKLITAWIIVILFALFIVKDKGIDYNEKHNQEVDCVSDYMGSCN